ncbi:MAG: metallophosphatase [Balneolaceae bacterium]|nr:metallophosphatase [Balneolaceae bacterium]
MITRKTFLKKTAYSLAGSTWIANVGSKVLNHFDGPSITILYTNDTHSRIDPFPDNAREFAGLGGIAKRSSLVDKIRLEEEHVLLLDAGDVFQGTPWFKMYGGKVDFEMMSKIGYDAMALGNHEFDLGLEGLAEAAAYADFPFLCANYSTWNTPINSFMNREVIKDFGGFTVGIFGLGIQLDGVVDPKLHGRVRHRDPILSARRSVENFRNYHQCDYIICLSHLGFRYEDDRIDDITLSQKIPEIDLIIGGHTHTFLDEPVVVENPNGSITHITQMGHGGVRVGRIDLNITNQAPQPVISSGFYTIGKDG